MVVLACRMVKALMAVHREREVEQGRRRIHLLAELVQKTTAVALLTGAVVAVVEQDQLVRRPQPLAVMVVWVERHQLRVQALRMQAAVVAAVAQVVHQAALQPLAAAAVLVAVAPVRRRHGTERTVRLQTEQMDPQT